MTRDTCASSWKLVWFTRVEKYACRISCCARSLDTIPSRVRSAATPQSMIAFEQSGEIAMSRYSSAYSCIALACQSSLIIRSCHRCLHTNPLAALCSIGLITDRYTSCRMMSSASFWSLTWRFCNCCFTACTQPRTDTNTRSTPSTGTTKELSPPSMLSSYLTAGPRSPTHTL